MSEQKCAQMQSEAKSSFMLAPPSREQRTISSLPPGHKAPPIVGDVLRTPGQPLDAQTRPFMEARFGHDFSNVRIHANEKAEQSARAVNALAYTVGQDIVFGAGSYQPSTNAGRKLIAHELTHVMQQKGQTQVADSNLAIGSGTSSWEREAEQISSTITHGNEPDIHPALGSFSPSPLLLSRQPRRDNRTAEDQQARSRPRTTTREHQPLRQSGSLTDIQLVTSPARIDNSKGIDEITRQFYEIPIELIPPNTTIPSGPILTIGTYGCSIRRYGLTGDEFSLTYRMDDRDMESTSRAFNILDDSSGMSTVHCWTNHVEFRARLRQTIILPNDIATHPCLQGQNPAQFRRETLEHERLHESDNRRAADETLRSLRERLAFTLGIGRGMAMTRITGDPARFVQECTTRIHASLERLRAEHEIMYHRLSAEYASILDPHDRELHELKQRLLEDARRRQSG
jgi:hypothetical protein